MKRSFYQWLIRTVLALTCLLTTTSAWADVTIYVNPSSPNYYMHYWGTGVTGTSWPGVQFSNTNSFTRETIGGINWYKITFSGVNTVNCIFNQGDGQPQTSDITNISGTQFFTYSGGTSYSNVTEQYTTTWTVAGDQALFGTDWNTGDTNNDMTTTDYVNFTWSKENVSLSQGKVEFKVVKNHSWDVAYPGSNYELNIPSNGTYNVTIIFNSNTHAVNAIATEVQTTPVFSPAPGTYDSNQDVTITAASGTIYYTTDGSDPETSKTRIAYTGPISIAGEGEHIIKAVAVSGNDVSDVVTAEYVIKYQNIYLFGSVGKAQAWNYSYTDPELITSDGINYSGVYNVNVMNDYHRSDNKPVGLFLLTKGFGTTWETTESMMIGTTSTTEDNHYWIDGGAGHFGEWLDTRPGSENVGNNNLHTNGWSLPAGTYEFFYNRTTGKLKVELFDGPTIYVYDYTRPYIYVEDDKGNPFDGVQPGNPIQILDETVGGHSGLSTVGDGTGDGTGTLGWYKFAVPVHPATCNSVKFQFHHNGDKKVIDSDEYSMQLSETTEAYYYWDGEQYVKLNSRADAVNLRRIVAHVRVQGTTVPTCDNQPMNGPSSFYGQMYYWMAVTKYNAGERMVITDGTHHYDQTITSDVYLEWTNEQGADYVVLDSDTLEHRLATKTGRGTVIHLQKNKNVPTSVTVNGNNYFVGVDTKVEASTGDLDHDGYVNTTNLGATWWGNNNAGYNGSKGVYQQVDGLTESQNLNPNFSNSQYLANDENAPVYTITAENGTEWYTWYSDRSVATIKFGMGTLTGNTQYPTYNPQENVYSFYANYESPQIYQQAGELWYVWTPDFNTELNDHNQSQNNGELIDVTRTYESRAKQKALCSTFRDGSYVYYTDIKGWGDDHVYCYVWTVPGLEWNNSVQMVKVGYDDEGHPVYLADLSNYNLTNATGIIFHNGKTSEDSDKRQTGNLPFENQGCYDYLGLLYRIGGNVDVIENEPDGFPTSVTLTGVWYSRVKGTLFAKGNNDYNNKSVNGMGYKDFAKTVNAGNEDGSVLQSRDYDQSNWVEIYPSEDGLINAETLIDLIGKPFTLYGTKTNSVNPTFTAISISNVGSVGEKYQPNHFTPIHLNGSCYQYRNGENEWYFFVEPKPNEFAIMDWATYHEDSDGHEYFYTLSKTGFDGEFVVDWSYFDKFNTEGYATIALEPYQMGLCGHYPGENYLKEGESYKGWYAIVKVNQSSTPAGDDVNAKAGTGSAGKYTVCPVYLSDQQIMTPIETINTDNASGMRTLKATRYYNMMGVESSTPFQGVNIIVKEYTDGSRESSKAIMR